LSGIVDVPTGDGFGDVRIVVHNANVGVRSELVDENGILFIANFHILKLYFKPLYNP